MPAPGGGRWCGAGLTQGAFGSVRFAAMAARVKAFIRRFRSAAAGAALALAGAAFAQNGAPPQPLPGLDDFSLPSSRPTPRPSPSPEPTTNPSPAAPPTPLAAPPPRIAPPPIVPTVRAIPAPRPTPRATAPRSLPTAAPPPEPAPAASPLPAPTAQASAAPVAAPAPFRVDPWMWLALAAVVVPAAGVGAYRWRRRSLDARAARRDGPRHEIVVFDTAAQPDETPPVPISSPSPEEMPPASISSSPAAPVAAPAARAVLDVTLIPKRAGTNLLSAAVDYAVVVRNTGDAAATAIRLDVRLLSAGPRQDALLSALFSTPVARPVTPPFDLPAAATVELGGMAMHPRETLDLLAVADRALFVPVLAVNLDYGWDGDVAPDGRGQIARAYAIGIDRGPDARLAPFRLDTTARMYDRISAVAYGVTVER